MSEDDYILDLAKQFSSTDETKHLLIVRDIAKYFESLDDSDEVYTAVVTIWNKNILSIMLLEMKKDFSDFETTSWLDGVSLVRAVYETLIQYIPHDRAEENKLHKRFYPDFVENILCFCRQLQDNYTRATAPDYRGILAGKELLKQMKIVLEISEGFVTKFADFVRPMLESPWFLQVFIADSEDTCVLSGEWLMNLVKLKPEVVKEVGRVVIKGIGNIMNTIVDELVYHLAITVNEQLIDTDLRCLLTILEADKSLLTILNHQYKGLKLILRKWSVNSTVLAKKTTCRYLPQNLNKLIHILDSGVVDLNQAQWAVIKIQAWWKSIAVRIRLMKTNKAFAQFQKNYRTRKSKERKQAEIQRIRKELEFQITMTRQKKFREKLEAEVLLMETLPAPFVLRHLEKSRHEAATKIQAQWRCRQEKARLWARKELYRKTKSVLTIQKYFRAWISRRDLAKENEKLNADVNVCLWRVPGLNAERKAELVKEYNKWFVLHKYKFKGLSEEEQMQIHYQSQNLKRKHFRGLRASRRQDLARESNMARIESDCKLLLSAPSLIESVEKETRMDEFHCKVMPIANRAAQLHRHQIDKIKLPWWKQLLIEEPSDLDADDDLLADVGDLNQYLILRNELSQEKERDNLDIVY